MRKLLLVLPVLLLALPAQSQTFNQCASSSSCPSTSVVNVGTFDAEVDTFETYFDALGPLPITPWFRCAWSWEAFYPPSVMNPFSFDLNYTELVPGEVNCGTVQPVTPPIGFPDNTAKVFCDVFDEDLADPFPPNFAPSVSDITITWETFDTGPGDYDATIVGGETAFFQEVFVNQCVLVQGPDIMATDLEVTVVPEPGTVAQLLAGGSLLFFFTKRRARRRS